MLSSINVIRKPEYPHAKGCIRIPVLHYSQKYTRNDQIIKYNTWNHKLLEEDIVKKTLTKVLAIIS